MPTNPRWSENTSLDAENSVRWKGLAALQHGVLSQQQICSFGLTRDSITANVQAHRWQQVLPRVYALFTGALPRESRISAALLYGGASAVLSHRTSAEEWGMMPIAAGEPVHITVPYGCSAVSQPWVRVHRSRAFRHIVADTDPPRTSKEDTIIDVAAGEPTAQGARDRFVHLAGSTPVALWRLYKQWEWRPPSRHRKAMQQALDLLHGGAVSVLEAEFALRVEQGHGLPTPLRQVPFEVDGLVLWEDLVYDNIGIPLTVRLDGRQFHSTARVAFRDRRRDNAAELADRRRLVYGWHEVHTDPCGVAREVASVLQRHGWTARNHCCPRCQGVVSGKAG